MPAGHATLRGKEVAVRIHRIIGTALGFALVLGLTGAVHAQVSKFRSARFKGEDYVMLADVAQHFNLGTDQSGADGLAVYRGLTAQADHRDVQLGGVIHWLNAPVALGGGRLWLARVDAIKTVDPVLRPSQFSARPRVSTVVIDPGHGGADRGTRGRLRAEKELTLDLARRVEAHLAGHGLAVSLTRRSDMTLGLPDRDEYARAKHADLFVSIHFNSAGNAASGIETYCLPPKGYPSTSVTDARQMDQQAESGNQFDAANVWLAHCVQARLLRDTGANDRGVRRARFLVLRDAPCPAILIEAGFLSNRYEEERILTLAYRETLATAIADGIVKYAESTGRQGGAARP